MKDQITSFKTAKLANEVGFDWECSNVFQVKYGEEVIELEYYAGDGSGVISNSSLDDNVLGIEDYLCTAPTQSLLQKWILEEFKIYIDIRIFSCLDAEGYTGEVVYLVGVSTFPRKGSFKDTSINILYPRNDTSYETYEKALEIGLQEALKFIKNGKNN